MLGEGQDRVREVPERVIKGSRESQERFRRESGEGAESVRESLESERTRSRESQDTVQ